MSRFGLGDKKIDQVSGSENFLPRMVLVHVVGITINMGIVITIFSSGWVYEVSVLGVRM